MGPVWVGIDPDDSRGDLTATWLTQPWPEPTERERQLEALAKRYIDETDAYDRTVCTGQFRDGTIAPRNYAELGMINRNAHRLLAKIKIDAMRIGFTSLDLVREIRREDRRRDSKIKPS